MRLLGDALGMAVFLGWDVVGGVESAGASTTARAYHSYPCNWETVEATVPDGTAGSAPTTCPSRSRATSGRDIEAAADWRPPAAPALKSGSSRSAPTSPSSSHGTRPLLRHENYPPPPRQHLIGPRQLAD